MSLERISIVTPTLNRPREVTELLDNLSMQTILPYELILVDGAFGTETRTEEAVAIRKGTLPYRVNYIRSGGGTAIQRNVGIDVDQGEFLLSLMKISVLMLIIFRKFSVFAGEKVGKV